MLKHLKIKKAKSVRWNCFLPLKYLFMKLVAQHHRHHEHQYRAAFVLLAGTKIPARVGVDNSNLTSSASTTLSI